MEWFSFPFGHKNWKLPFGVSGSRIPHETVCINYLSKRCYNITTFWHILMAGGSLILEALGLCQLSDQKSDLKFMADTRELRDQLTVLGWLRRRLCWANEVIGTSKNVRFVRPRNSDYGWRWTFSKCWSDWENNELHGLCRASSRPWLISVTF